MVSYDFLGPGGRVILHAQILFVQSDVKMASSQCWKAHAEWRRRQVRRQELNGSICKPTLEYNACLCE